MYDWYYVDYRTFLGLKRFADKLKFSERKELADIEKHLVNYIILTTDKKFLLYTSMPFSDKELGNHSIRKLGLNKVACSRCETTSHKFNLPTGCLKPKYMVIGEAPGIANKKSFAIEKVMAYGKVSDMLRRCFWELGIHDKVWYTNIVKCSVPENRRVTYEEAKKCKGWLKREIEFLQPKVIFVLGKNTQNLFEELHSQYIPEQIQVIYLKHPNWFIRNGLTWKDYMKHIKSKGKE